MAFSLTQLFTIGLTYLAILFGSAYATERGWLPRWLTRHPAIRVLSLGVFAGAICFYGTLGLAANHGSGFLVYFIGASAAFLVAPLLLGPLSRVALGHKLGSLADVFAFRYPAPWVGGAVTCLMLLGLLPLIALQIHAVSVTLHLLNQDLGTEALALLFCVTMIIFAVLFGARHLSTRDKHQGLVFAIAIESVIKLVAFVAVALYCVFAVFGGIDGLQAWLAENRERLVMIEDTLSEGESRSLLLMFFAAAVALPHVYHILLTENDDEQMLAASRWGFPAYMLVLSACVPVIVWGALRLGADVPPEYFAIGVGLMSRNETITILAFIAGLAAASGVLIVSTLALASMTLNHVLLPFYRPLPGFSFYSLLINTRRILIGAIILGAYGVNRLIGGQELMSLGTVAFVAVIQFLPGLVGTFYWRNANKEGFIAGLTAGYLVWFLTLFFPLVSDLVYSSVLTSSPLLYEQRLYEPQENAWHFAATVSLLLNAGVFIVVSLATETSLEERHAANDCMSDSFSRPWQGEVVANSVAGMEQGLGEIIGRPAATREINLALSELSLSNNERRPHALTMLRNRLESSLTSLLGQTIARSIISRAVPLRADLTHGYENVHAIETRLEDQQLTGLTAELDALRRYHRQILQDLPTAVCSINPDGQVLSWNRAMEILTGIEANIMVGSTLAALPPAWHNLLTAFAFGPAIDETRQELVHNGETLLLNLHKASIEHLPSAPGDVVVVIEDMTDEHRLEQQLLHSERLASIGQLAAGVAHEVGNPITGIACLAQNLKIDPDPAEIAETSNQILEQTDRISAILQSLVNFSRAGSTPAAEAVPVNLRQCTDEAIRLLSLSQQDRGVRFDNRCPPELMVLGDPQRLAQVFVNVLTNARDASVAGGVVTVSGAGGAENVSITVADTGHGMKSEHLKRMFEPFFTTKDPGEGTGLGLAIVNSIVEEHSGTITASSAGDGKGTCVTLTLPTLSA